MKKFFEKRYKIIIVIILAFMAMVSIPNAWNDSAIFDETAHIPAGYSYVTEHDMRLNPEHPPLLKDLAGLMLLPMNLKFDTTKAFWTTDINGQWDAGRDLLWQEGNNADQLIFWSRIPIVILSLLLGLFIFKWARELAGISAGLFALALYAFDPNILGHNHFVTTDLGIAAFMVFSFYYFLRFIKDPNWKNIFTAGLFLGLVQLAKFSSITLFPIFGLLLLVYPLVKKKRSEQENNFYFRIRQLGRYLGKGAVVFAFSLIVVWGIYAVNFYKTPEQKMAGTVEYYFPHNDPSSNARMTNQITLALNKSAITRPLSEYILGIAMVFKRVDGGNGAYFMQQVSGTAFPAYFPIVFLLKEPLILLFFMLLAVTLGIFKTLKPICREITDMEKEEANIRLLAAMKRFARYNIVNLSLLAFIILYAYISITGNLNIGFRHLFPILPFIYILTAKSIFDFIKRLEKNSRTIWYVILLIFTLFLAGKTLAAYPAYMSYFNEVAGGSKNGYRFVTDSNADWGQDLKRLKKWVNDYNYCNEMKCDPNLKFGCPDLCYSPEGSLSKQLGTIKKIRLNYFGGADIKYYFGETAIDWWDSRRPIEPGWYAISTNHLMGSIYDKTKPDSESYRWISGIEPVSQIGTSIFVYYITPEQIDNIK